MFPQDLIHPPRSWTHTAKKTTLTTGLTKTEIWWNVERLLPEGKLASESNVTQACNSKRKNVGAAVESEIFLYQVCKEISAMLLTFH